MLTPSRRRPPLMEELCLELAEKIRTAVYPAGKWLPPERSLAERLGVSRTALREALKRLESQGLVDVHHGIGIQVVDCLHKAVHTSVTLRIPDRRRRLQQLMEARLLIEPEVARLAAQRATQAQRRQLREIQMKLGDAKTTEEAAKLDVAFHHALAHAAGNEVFALMLDAVAELDRESRRLTIARYGVEKPQTHHEKILGAIERGKKDEAARLMRVHIQMATNDLANELSHGARNVRRSVGKCCE